jgi:hypothetical protein
LNKSNSKTLSFISILVLIATLNIALVGAQDTATVIVTDGAGGTTDLTGSQTYNAGDTVTITATPDDGYVHSSWVLSPSDGSGDLVIADNPLTFTAAAGVTYTVIPVFIVPSSVPGQPLPSDLSKAAIVVVLPSAGGITNPPEGTYALADASSLSLKATASSGWQFSHWTICGTQASHGDAPTNWSPTDNPYVVDHGYSDVYRYQAIFVPVGAEQPTPTPTPGGTVGGMSTETWIIIALVIVIIVMLVGFGLFLAKRK